MGGFMLAMLSISSAQTKQGRPPSDANMFVGTPAGWVQPKTPWGDPDLQGTWPISYVGTVPLERCAGGGGRGGAPCDPNKAFLTEEEYKARVEAASKQVDRAAEALKQGEGGRLFIAGVTDLTAPQRQTSLIMDPPNGRLPEMTAEGKRAFLFGEE